MQRAVWAPARDFYKKNAFPASLVRPQAGETSHKKQLSCERARERLSLLFPVSRRISPLRRRPKGFPVALWKPSGPLQQKGICSKEDFVAKRNFAVKRDFVAKRNFAVKRDFVAKGIL